MSDAPIKLCPTCGSPKVTTKGLCSPCYFKEWRAHILIEPLGECRKCGGTKRFPTGQCADCARDRKHRQVEAKGTSPHLKPCERCNQPALGIFCMACIEFECEVCGCKVNDANHACTNQDAHEDILRFKSKAQELRQSSWLYRQAHSEDDYIS